MLEIIDMISHDIKGCDLYLEIYGIFSDFSFPFLGIKRLIWDRSAKRILLDTGSIKKPLIEHTIPARVEAYDYLPEFLDAVVKNQGVDIDVTSIKQKHYEIRKIIGIYS